MLTIATDAPFVGVRERAGTIAIEGVDCCATAVAGGTTAVARVVAKFATAVARGIARNPAIAVSLEFGLRWKDVIRALATCNIEVDGPKVSDEERGNFTAGLATIVTNATNDPFVV